MKNQRKNTKPTVYTRTIKHVNKKDKIKRKIYITVCITLKPTDCC